MQQNRSDIIKTVLAADKFEIHELKLENNSISVIVTNTKFRSTAQAVGRIASTLQRFTSDEIKKAKISFKSQSLITATYKVDLEQITKDQFNPVSRPVNDPSIIAVDIDKFQPEKNYQRFTWV